MVIGLEDAPTTLNPDGANAGVATYEVVGNIYGTLVRTDMRGPGVHYIPALADSWTTSPDGRAWTFHLHPGVNWQDGVPFTSADVAFSWKEFWVPATSIPLLTAARISTPNPLTFQVRLQRRFDPMLYILSESASDFVLPAHIFDHGGPLATNPAAEHPVGIGPFKLKSWVRGSSITLVRNPNYYIKARPYLNSLIFQTITDPASRALALQTGSVNFLTSLQLLDSSIPAYEHSSKFTVIHGGEGPEDSDFLLMNLGNPYLRHLAVRQAIAYALNRTQLAKFATFGQGRPSKGIMGPDEPFYDGTYDTYTQDVSRANQLLDQAGYRRSSNGTRFALNLFLQNGHDYEERAVQVIKAQLAAVGIAVTIHELDLAAILSTVFTQRHFDLMLQLWGTGPDPTAWITYRYQKASIGLPFGNAMGYDNPELEHIFAIEAFTPPAERRALWNRVQQVILQQLPVFPLFMLPNIEVVSSNFHDVVTSAWSGYLSQPRDQAYCTQC